MRMPSFAVNLAILEPDRLLVIVFEDGGLSRKRIYLSAEFRSVDYLRDADFEQVSLDEVNVFLHDRGCRFEIKKGILKMLV